MNTSLDNTGIPHVAVWYFVGATFVFAAHVLFFRDADLWLRIALFAAGFVVVVAGGVQLGREVRQRRRDAPPPEDAPTARE